MWHLSFPTDETLEWYKELFFDSIVESVRKSTLKKVVKTLLLSNDGKDYIEKLLVLPPKDLYPLNAKLEKELKKLGGYDTTKNKIRAAFDYEGHISGDKVVAYKLAKKIGTRTCVYCNRIYSFTIEMEDGKTVARPDFDHWLPKDKHPLLSMSFFNLIPSCPICNRSIKHRKDFEYGKHVHPYASTEETSFRFQYVPLPANQWKLTLANASTEELATAEILKTEDIYKPYANSEVKDLLDFAYKNSPEYLTELRNKVMVSFGGTITKEYAYRMIFGTELNASLFLDRPLSKMKRDVLGQLQESLGIELVEFDT